MSYILDALKRADAERGRGAVPGLHARQLPDPGSAAPSHTPSRVWMLIATAAALAAMAVGLWVWRTPFVAAPVAVPTPLVAPVPMPAAPAPVAPAVIALPVRPSVAPKPQAASPKAIAKAATPSRAVQASAPPAAPAPIPLLSELPDALRRQLPALAITGTVYSDDPKQRLLLVNNQVLPQGSQVAPEVTLEEIRPRNSVFNFRGTRFRVAH